MRDCEPLQRPPLVASAFLGRQLGQPVEERIRARFARPRQIRLGQSDRLTGGLESVAQFDLELFGQPAAMRLGRLFGSALVGARGIRIQGGDGALDLGGRPLTRRPALRFQGRHSRHHRPVTAPCGLC